MQEIVDPWKLSQIMDKLTGSDASVGLVPTMGALHAGHMRLAQMARRESNTVVMSIFVNPTQFGPSEDFDRYPRDLARDREMAADAGVDLLFIPKLQTMYPNGAGEQQIWVDPGRLADNLCGATRPGHFRGVATIVSKLFHMVQPQRAYFGQKDGQQALIIQSMVADLAFPIEIRIIPTVRERDGLALSSRNIYLSREERLQAPVLYHALTAARKVIENGELHAGPIETILRREIAGASLARLEYATVADQHSLQPVTGIMPEKNIIAVAAYFGKTRLIDNLMVGLQYGVPTFS